MVAKSDDMSLWEAELDDIDKPRTIAQYETLERIYGIIRERGYAFEGATFNQINEFETIADIAADILKKVLKDVRNDTGLEAVGPISPLDAFEDKSPVSERYAKFRAKFNDKAKASKDEVVLGFLKAIFDVTSILVEPASVRVNIPRNGFSEIDAQVFADRLIEEGRAWAIGEIGSKNEAQAARAIEAGLQTRTLESESKTAKLSEIIGDLGNLNAGELRIVQQTVRILSGNVSITKGERTEQVAEAHEVASAPRTQKLSKVVSALGELDREQLTVVDSLITALMTGKHSETRER